MTFGLWLVVAAAQAFDADPWQTAFESERSREIPASASRVVLAIGDDGVAPGAALCDAVGTAESPCTVKVLPRRARRDTDEWLAVREPRGMVWVVRPMQSLGVSVALYDEEREALDWYTARPGVGAANALGMGQLEGRIAALEGQVASLARATPPPPSEGDEEAGARLLQAATEAADAFDVDAAVRHLDELSAVGPATRANRAAQRVRAELAIVGEAVPALAVERWFQGEGTWDAAAPSLWVFWEPWCPYSRKALPALQPMFDELGGPGGLQLVALTRLTRGTSAADVRSFVEEHALSYPIAKEQGRQMSDDLGVRGLPAAVLVARGKVVWRGHPATLDREMLAAFLKRAR